MHARIIRYYTAYIAVYQRINRSINRSKYIAFALYPEMSYENHE